MAVEYKLIPKRNPQNTEAAPKYYASVVYGKTVTLAQLAKEVAALSTTASEGDVFSVLINVRDLIRSHVSNSERVCIDGIGTFEIGISSQGADSMDGFHPTFVKDGRLKFRPDMDMRQYAKSLKYVRYFARDGHFRK